METQQSAESGPSETEQPDGLELDQLHPEELEQLIAEVNALDLGTNPANEVEAHLHRYLKMRGRLVDEMRRIEESTAKMVRRLENRISGLDHVCQASAADLVKEMIRGKKAKSIVTPFGTCGFRKVPTRLVVNDESKLPDRFFETVRKRSDRLIKDEFQSTGALPDGVDITGGNDVFYVK